LGKLEPALPLHQAVLPLALVGEPLGVGVGSLSLRAPTLHGTTELGNDRGRVVGGLAFDAPKQPPLPVHRTFRVIGKGIGNPYEVQIAKRLRTPHGVQSADEHSFGGIEDLLRLRSPGPWLGRRWPCNSSIANEVLASRR